MARWIGVEWRPRRAVFQLVRVGANELVDGFHESSIGGVVDVCPALVIELGQIHFSHRDIIYGSPCMADFTDRKIKLIGIAFVRIRFHGPHAGEVCNRNNQ